MQRVHRAHNTHGSSLELQCALSVIILDYIEVQLHNLISIHRERQCHVILIQRYLIV